MKKILIILGLMIFSSISFCVNTVTISNGNWNSNSTWSNGVPSNNDNAFINHIVNITSNSNVKNITINSNKTLKNSGFRIQVYGNWTNNGSYIDTIGEVRFRGNIQQLNGNTTFYDLVINSNNKVIVNDTILVKNLLTLSSNILDVTNGILIIFADATYDGRLDVISNTGNIIGDFIFQKWVDRCNKWSLYGGPFGVTLNNYADSATGQMIYTGFPNSDYPTFSNSLLGWGPNSYLWDENWNTASQGWVIPNGNSILPRGKGFWYWNSDTIFNVPFSTNPIIQKWKVSTKGSIDFTTTFNFPVQYTNTGDITSDGWNLVSNPYPGIIDWNSNGFSRTRIDNAIYVFNTCNQNYMSYVGGVGVNGGTRYVSTFQGFYVKANNNNPILTSDRRVVTNNSSPLVKSTNLQDNVLRIELGNDEIIIRENDLADSLFNSDYDAYKFMDNATIYSKNYGDVNTYSINTVDSTTTKIPLYTIGNGILNFSDIITWEPIYDLWLEDLTLGTFISLNTITSYPFNSMIPNGILTNRFIIHLHNPNIITDIKEYSNKNKTLIKVVNILGQYIDQTIYKGIMIYHYSDGSFEKKIRIGGN